MAVRVTGGASKFAAHSCSGTTCSIIDPIASRCAKFRFKPLQQEAMLVRLKHIAAAEELDVSDAVRSKPRHVGWRCDSLIRCLLPRRTRNWWSCLVVTCAKPLQQCRVPQASTGRPSTPMMLSRCRESRRAMYVTSCGRRFRAGRLGL